MSMCKLLFRMKPASLTFATDQWHRIRSAYLRLMFKSVELCVLNIAKFNGRGKSLFVAQQSIKKCSLTIYEKQSSCAAINSSTY